MKSLDIDEFVIADEDVIAAGIAGDTQEKYEENLAEEFEQDASEEEAPEDAEPEEDSEEEDVEENETVEDEDSEEEEPPKKTGNKEVDGKNHALWAAREKLRKEREERSKLEKQLAFLEGKLENATPKQQQEIMRQQQEIEEELEEFDFSDLEGSVEKRYHQLRKREIAKEQQQRLEEENARWQQLVAYSRKEALDEYPDYEEVEAAFVARMNTPEGEHLKPLLLKQADPADWAYRKQKSFEKRVTRKSPEVEALEARIAELEELTKKGSKPVKRKTMASARGAGTRKTSKPGPADADELFKDVFSRKR